MAQKSAAFPVKHQIKQSKHSSAVQSDDSAYFVNLCLKGSQLLLPSYCSCFGKVRMADFFWLFFFLDTRFESESEWESSDDDEDDDEDDEEDEVSCRCFFDFLCFFFFKSESESESSVDDEDDDDDECFFCFFFLELLCLDLEDLY